MKKQLNIALATILLASGPAFAHEEGVTTTAKAKVSVAAKKKKTTKKVQAAKKVYTCPMDGGSYDKPGKCPKCGMDLVEKK